MRGLQILPVLMIICGCSMFKRTTKTIDEAVTHINDESSESTELESIKQSSGKETFSIRDSLGNNYTIQLWPRGQFYFYSGGDFSGEFDSIRMTGKEKRLTLSNSSNQVNANESEKIKTDSHHQQKLKTARSAVTKIRAPDSKVVLMSSVVLIIIFCLYKFWKNKG